MPAKNLDDGKQPKDTSKGVGPMPHQAFAAGMRATADPNGPMRTLNASEFKAAAELGDWAAKAKAADKG